MENKKNVRTEGENSEGAENRCIEHEHKENIMGPKNRYRIVIIYDIPKDLKATEVAQAVRVQNKEIPMDKFQRDFQVNTRTDTGNSFTMLKLRELNKIRKICVEYSSCRVKKLLSNVIRDVTSALCCGVGWAFCPNVQGGGAALLVQCPNRPYMVANCSKRAKKKD